MLLPRPTRLPLRLALTSTRTFTTTRPLRLPAKPLPPLRPIPDSEILETFLKGSGPGGQKINKTSSAVQLKHLPTGIVVKCQETRSRSQNRKMARRLLGERIEEVELGEGARTRVKGREVARRKRSGEKKRRRKYRRLEGGKDGESDGEGEAEVEVEGEGDGKKDIGVGEGDVGTDGKAG